MKEMLFITVAILIPPTLTYMGFVGNESADRQERRAPQVSGENSASAHQHRQPADDDSGRWYESSM